MDFTLHLNRATTSFERDLVNTDGDRYRDLRLDIDRLIYESTPEMLDKNMKKVLKTVQEINDTARGMESRARRRYAQMKGDVEKWNTQLRNR